MSYAELADLKAWMSGGTDIDTADDTLLQAVLDAVTRWIDRKCGRHFTFEDNVTKYFYPSADGRISVPDLISITTLHADTSGDRSYATALASTDYELLPYMDEAGIPSVRFQEVRVWPTSSHQLASSRLVRIVGDFGYAAVPGDIKQACLIQATRVWKRREMPTGTVSIPDIGTVERIPRADPDVEALLAPYVRTRSWVVV